MNRRQRRAAARAGVPPPPSPRPLLTTPDTARGRFVKLDGTAPTAREAMESAEAMSRTLATGIVGGRYTIDMGLEDAPSAERAIALVEEGGRYVATLAGVYRAHHGVEPACRAGCSACCAMKVSVAVPEVLRIAAWLRITQPAAHVDAVRARVEATAARTAGMDCNTRWRAQVPCALLTPEGTCGVYPVRPLVCVGHNSLDASYCGPDKPGSLPTFWPQEKLAQGYAIGVGLGLHDRGLDGRPVELHAGLAIALADPDAGARWMRGEPVFGSALARDAVPGGDWHAYVRNNNTVVPPLATALANPGALAALGLPPIPPEVVRRRGQP